MKKAIIILAGIVGAIVAQVSVSKALTPSIDKQIVSACNEIHKNTPFLLDKFTRLDTASPLPGEIRYLYTIIGINILSSEQKTTIEKNTRNHVQNASDLNSVRENGIDMSYLYRSESGKEVFKFTIKH